jgi:hypothetical protein
MSSALDSDLLMVMSLAGDAYVGLDAVGGHIWTLLAEPMPLCHLSDRLTREYEGEPDEMRRDILAFLGQLEAAGLLCIAGSENTTGTPADRLPESQDPQGPETPPDLSEIAALNTTCRPLDPGVDAAWPGKVRLWLTLFATFVTLAFAFGFSVLAGRRFISPSPRRMAGTSPRPMQAARSSSSLSVSQPLPSESSRTGSNPNA